MSGMPGRAFRLKARSPDPRIAVSPIAAEVQNPTWDPSVLGAAQPSSGIVQHVPPSGAQHPLQPSALSPHCCIRSTPISLSSPRSALSVLESPCNQEIFPCSLCSHHVEVSSAPALPFTTSSQGWPVDRRLFQALHKHTILMATSQPHSSTGRPRAGGAPLSLN